MKKSLAFFVAGLVSGAAALFLFDRLPRASAPVSPPAEVAAASSASMAITGAASAPIPAARATVSGVWKGTLDVQGQNVPFSLAITETGTDLSGVVSALNISDVRCDHVVIDPAGNVSFAVHVQGKGATFTGRLAPDSKSMMGSSTSSVGSGDWSLAKN